jgi:predicted O-linked N-acetylglucosamine transferase (SPINDLY family)
VFCCFNNSFKIGPAEFDIWMRLLRRIEGSVLWLFEGNRWVKNNLRGEATKRGIDPDRLVFASHMSHGEHLARLRHADIFLDCFSCNAHATASDALWAGVPVITALGQSFTARVGASLAQAIGLPELVAVTPVEYERIALELASDPARLAALRERLAQNRNTAPLFDSARFTRHIETAFEMAWDRALKGEKPDHLEVGALPGTWLTAP